MPANSMLDTRNSVESDTLGTGQNYIGQWTDITAFGSVVVAAKSTGSGLLFLEQTNRSSETTADSSLTYSLTANVNEVHTLVRTRRYFRVRLLSTAAEDVTYEVSSFLDSSKGPLSAPANLPVGLDADATVSRIISEEFDIGRGLRSGISKSNKWGKNSDVDSASVPEFVIEGIEGAYTGFPLTDVQTVRVTSTSASDTAAGTGAQAVTFSGLGDNWQPQSETVEMNGLAGATSQLTWRRIHTGRVSRAGSGLINAGEITITHSSTTSNVFLKILAGIGQSNFAVYTVPAGKLGIVVTTTSYIRRGTSASADGAFWVREFGETFRYRRPFTVSLDSPFVDRPYGGVSFPEKTDIALVITFVSANNLSITGGFDIILVDI